MRDKFVRIYVRHSYHDSKRRKNILAFSTDNILASHKEDFWTIYSLPTQGRIFCKNIALSPCGRVRNVDTIRLSINPNVHTVISIEGERVIIGPVVVEDRTARWQVDTKRVGQKIIRRAINGEI